MAKIKNKEDLKVINSINNQVYEEAATTNINELLIEYNSSELGLNEEEVNQSRNLNGNNKISHGKKKPLFKRIVTAFIDPFTVILLILAIVSTVTDIIIPLILANYFEIDFLTVGIILTMVIVSGILKFIQETKSGNAAAKLLTLITTTVEVKRKDVGYVETALNDLVVGDIIHLSAGNMIPADVRIYKSKELFINQSALTGESEYVEKYADDCLEFNESLDAKNLAFMGSNVISGTATALVLRVGDQTILGNIAKTVAKPPLDSSFEKGIKSVSWLLIRFMMVMVPLVFLINGFTKVDDSQRWIHALFFALSIAVGLTPEMLPMIVTTCLAKGAVTMSKKKTVIKNLNSIQNFGAMDILCTDKTGTLTQDKIVLQYHLDVYGVDNKRVLQYAFLNSYHQTGLKNLIDIAIIEAKDLKPTEFNQLTNQYVMVDEIPFDFNRRRMSVVVKGEDGQTVVITKGAVEEMLSICTLYDYQGEIQPLNQEIIDEISKVSNRLNNDGFRVIALASKKNPSLEGNFHVSDEAEMVLMGYLAFLDPPKETTEAAIKALKEYGVTTKILTGDNEKVTACVCRQVGFEVSNILLGVQIAKLNDQELKEVVETTNVFAKLSPDQKTRVVHALRDNGHVVGFMGDGINDAAAIKAADIGISVDTAVDIAKESADIILLEKDLLVLEKGIIEGRKTYANMIKYIKMTASSNFGNMFSVLIASALLPFLPMLSIHILLLNLIYDLCCVAIPWDNVDNEYLKKPRKWEAKSVGRFMLWIGPTSSIFDITTYLLMYFLIAPMVTGGLMYHQITDSATRALFIATFQAGWFVESMWTQTLVIHMIRTKKIPFIQSRASFPVFTLTFTGIIILTIIPFTPLGAAVNLAPLPLVYFAYLAATILGYMLIVTVVKKLYIRRYGELL